MLESRKKLGMLQGLMLSRVKKLAISFAPLSHKSKSAIGLLARVRGPSSRKSNPDCIVEHNLLVEGEPSVDVEFSNNEKQTFMTALMSEKQIISDITEKCLIIETEEVLKKANLFGTKLEVAADENRYYAGVARKIPIT